ncbi:MAG: hypothetical protein ACI9TH_003540 [Kiritimatiellia bacterium]|jgi:hypothetical protein
MKTWMTLITVIAMGLFTGCGGGDEIHTEDDGHDHEAHADHAEHGPNGGELLEVGDHLAHIELIHDAAAKSITLHILGPDAKTALTLDEAPVLNVTVDGSAIQVPLEGTAATFKAEHEAFAGEPEGRISLKMAGKTWQVALAHNHDHAGHDH